MYKDIKVGDTFRPKYGISFRYSDGRPAIVEGLSDYLFTITEINLQSQKVKATHSFNTSEPMSFNIKDIKDYIKSAGERGMKVKVGDTFTAIKGMRFGYHDNSSGIVDGLAGFKFTVLSVNLANKTLKAAHRETAKPLTFDIKDVEDYINKGIEERKVRVGDRFKPLKGSSFFTSSRAYKTGSASTASGYSDIVFTVKEIKDEICLITGNESKNLITVYTKDVALSIKQAAKKIKVGDKFRPNKGIRFNYLHGNNNIVQELNEYILTITHINHEENTCHAIRGTSPPADVTIVFDIVDIADSIIKTKEKKVDTVQLGDKFKAVKGIPFFNNNTNCFDIMDGLGNPTFFVIRILKSGNTETCVCSDIYKTVNISVKTDDIKDIIIKKPETFVTKKKTLPKAKKIRIDTVMLPGQTIKLDIELNSEEDKQKWVGFLCTLGKQDEK